MLSPASHRSVPDPLILDVLNPEAESFLAICRLRTPSILPGFVECGRDKEWRLLGLQSYGADSHIELTLPSPHDYGHP